MNKYVALETAEMDEPWPPAFTEEALALRFAETHRDNLRYIAKWGKWMSWAGTHWQFDDILHAFDMVRMICREAAAQCNKPKISSAIASGKTVAAVERLARADKRLAATVDQWDADPWLLNTPAGTWDLRKGNIKPHDPNDYCTKITACSAEGECPLFIGFLEDIFAGDHELIAYLQRVIGYSLTGSTQEHALFFAYGTGANGKSVLLNTAAKMLGNYQRTAPIETFTATFNERHPTDLAGLRGARLVTATETEEGRRWAESKIKQLTGGDEISARFMRQDYFEYTPQFKLFVAGNHKPGLRAVDEAMRRRFHLIPFAVTIPIEKRDPELAEKLRAEWSGVLNWAITGCFEWQRIGLKMPHAVRAATDEYLESEDAIAAWIAEKCEPDLKAWESASRLFSSWNSWATRAGEVPGTLKRFNQNLATRGYQKHKTNKGQGFFGLRVINEFGDDDQK
jgi:putative DNA primase/helicase